MYKKLRCTCKAVVLSTKSIVIFDVLVAVASSDRIGTLRSNDADGNENVKKNNRVYKQNNNFAPA